ncbi:MAG: hypothetical protein ABJG78_05905 [Cyclobacteriaceae bacterium]
MKPIKLDDIEKKSQPYSVPEGYFEDLPMKIQGRISQQKKESWIKMPAVKLAFAAGAMLAIVMSVVFVNQSVTPEDLLADIPEEELLAYIDMLQIDENDILAAFEGSVESIDFFDANGLEDLELEDEYLDDLLIEYDLSDDYL